MIFFHCLFNVNKNRFLTYCKLSIFLILISCDGGIKLEDKIDGIDNVEDSNSYNCDNAQFPDWSRSSYVLPYSVGKAYAIGLSSCSTSYHAPGKPDEFAVDFKMPIGSEVIASKGGTVVHVEESGQDFSFPNNLVVVKSGSSYIQYMHLTQNGAFVKKGQIVSKGDIIGYSGATGLAGYPHLHFVVTFGAWEYPYISNPVTFKNTQPNPEGLKSGVTYKAL